MEFIEKKKMFQSSRSSSGAMLILMALTMAFSIITAAALAISINNINIKTLSERSRSLVKELDMVESKFEETLNARIINPEFSSEEAIYKTFKEVVENFSKIELTHGIFFNATNPEYNETLASLTFDVVIVQKNTKISGKVTVTIT